MAGEIEALLDSFTEDVELHYNCSKFGLFPAGCWQGRPALRDCMRRVDTDYEPLEAEVQDVVAEGDREAAETRLDRIELSPAAREITADGEAAREAKLAALRAQIDAGTYQVDASGVARRIVAREEL